MDRKPDESLMSLLAMVHFHAGTRGVNVTNTVWAAMSREAAEANRERRELIVSGEEKDQRIEAQEQRIEELEANEAWMLKTLRQRERAAKKLSEFLQATAKTLFSERGQTQRWHDLLKELSERLNRRDDMPLRHMIQEELERG